MMSAKLAASSLGFDRVKFDNGFFPLRLYLFILVQIRAGESALHTVG